MSIQNHPNSDFPTLGNSNPSDIHTYPFPFIILLQSEIFGDMDFRFEHVTSVEMKLFPNSMEII